MAAVSNNNIAEAIYMASRGKNGEESTLFVKNVVRFLARKGLLGKAKDIISRLSIIAHKHEGKVLAKVSSTGALDSHTKEALTNSLMKRYDAKEVMLEEKIDEGLVGGLKIEVGDEVIDLSVRNKIKQLKEHLTQ